MELAAQPHSIFRLPTGLSSERGVAEVMRIAEKHGGALFEGNGRSAFRLASKVSAECPEGWNTLHGSMSQPSGVVFLTIFKDGCEPQLWGWPVRQ